MSLIPPQIKFALKLALCAILFLAGWIINGWRWEAKYADQLASARKTEQSLQETMDADTIKFFRESQRIIDSRDAAIDRLRTRPERLSEGARANCKGSSGAELSREDGNFLIREASESNKRRAALESCYASYDKIKAEINGD